MMYFLHYPSGGFGHYMLQMMSICFDSVYCPQTEITFSEDGNSHSYPLHHKTWFHREKFSVVPLYDFGDLHSICLIDSGITDDDLDYVFEKFPDARVIRMCLDTNSKSIINQTCKFKAERSEWDFYSDLDWERREQFTLVYHHADKNPGYFLNNFQPDSRCINITISDLFFNTERLLDQLTSEFGNCNYTKFNMVHNNFLQANEKYAKGMILVNQVTEALRSDVDFDIDPNDYSLHDQGYLIYWLEKQYNINEIPPYDYRDWFSSMTDIRTCLKLIPLQ